MKALIPALLWAGFILIICGIPGQNLPRLDLWMWLKPDKFVHVLVFGILSFLFIRAFVHPAAANVFKTHPKKWAVFIGLIYGAVIELLQEYVFIGRTGDLKDVVANAMGSFVGCWRFAYRGKKKLPGNTSS